ncbi:MAG: hypothetical protein Q8K45_21670 [Rubrivivax sp.]|nr:hypothetical protein [Rubrivivax sp.]
MTRRFADARPLQAWLLAALLLVAQGLGLSHRVAHAPGLAPAALAVPALGEPQGRLQASAFGAAGHEADTAVCRLIDQLAHADGLCDGPWAAAPAVQATLAHDAAPTAAPRAGSASAYLARAPPLA